MHCLLWSGKITIPNYELSQFAESALLHIGGGGGGHSPLTFYGGLSIALQNKYQLPGRPLAWEMSTKFGSYEVVYCKSQSIAHVRTCICIRTYVCYGPIRNFR